MRSVSSYFLLRVPGLYYYLPVVTLIAGFLRVPILFTFPSFWSLYFLEITFNSLFDLFLGTGFLFVEGIFSLDWLLLMEFLMGLYSLFLASAFLSLQFLQNL